MVLFHLQNNSDVIDDQAFSLEHADPESFILAVCQFARCLADEVIFLVSVCEIRTIAFDLLEPFKSETLRASEILTA